MTELMVRTWHKEKAHLAMENLDARAIQELLYRLAGLCTDRARCKRGAVRDVTTALGGSLIAPPVDATKIQRYFGEIKAFGAIDKLITIVTKGVPVQAVRLRRGLERSLLYGNPRSVAGYMPVIWDNLCEDARR